MFFSYINEIYLVAHFWWNVSLDELGVGEFPMLLFGKLIIVAEFPRAADISENLQYHQLSYEYFGKWFLISSFCQKYRWLPDNNFHS